MSIAKVQSVTGNGATLVLNSVVPSNSLICIASTFRAPSTGVAAAIPADSNGTFSIASADTPSTFTSGTTDDCGVAIWWQPNVAAGTHTVTPEALNGFDATLVEFSGLTTASPFDVAKSAVTNNGSQTSQVTGTTAATAQADELVIIGLALAAAAGVANVGLTDPVSGFQTLHINQTDSTGIACLHAFKVISATGTQAATFNWTDSEANQASHGAIATFKAAAGGAGASASMPLRRGRGVGMGPSGRRMMPQAFADTSPAVVELTAKSTVPFRPGKGPGSGPTNRRRLPQRFPDAVATNAVLGELGTHTYTARTPQVQVRVAPGQVTHSYTGVVPQVRAQVQPAQVTHTYLARVPQVQARVAPAQATHTYLARSPQVRSQVQPGAVLHTYLGQVPGITTGGVVLALRGTHLYSALAPTIIFSTGSTQPGGGIYRAGRQLVIARKYLEDILGEDAEEQDFLESVSETIKEAEKPSTPELSREIGILSALDAITHAYNVHFETVGAARAAINERLVEFEDDDLMAVLMILAMADEP